jgi:hypothetical protein
MTKMTSVTEIETVDGEYCLSLRGADGRDFVLFAFPTEAEAGIARKALRQIVEHASVVLPVTKEDRAQSTPAPDESEKSDSGERRGHEFGATSPFSDP